MASPLTRRALFQHAGIAGAGVAAGSLGINALAPVVAPERWGIDTNASYWSRSLPAPNPALAPAGRELEADVAIIGGGFTGLATAYYLRQVMPGRTVVVLEAHRCGNGASARNGAMLLPSTGDRYLVPGVEPAIDRRIHELTVANMRSLRELELAHGIDAEIDTPGAVHVLGTAAQARQAAADAARLTDAGIPIEFWNRERTAAAIGTPAYHGALACRSAGQVHPGKLVALWKRAAEDAGAVIHEHSPVTQIDAGPTHRLTTAAGARVRTPVLVLACNAYSAQLGYLQHATVPVWDYVAITPPLAAAQIEAIGWQCRAPFDDDHTETWYLGLTRDNRVHIGGGPVDYGFNGGVPRPELARERHRGLHDMLARLYPALAQVPFEAVWAGAVDMSLDASPAVGRMGTHGNIYYGIGYSGHGVNLTSVFGRILADLIGGAEERWRWFPYLHRLPPYIPSEPFRWLGIRASLAAIRATEP